MDPDVNSITHLKSKLITSLFFMFAVTEVANAQRAVECQRTYGGVVCNERRENVWDSLNKLTNTLNGIKEERETKKLQSEMQARIVADEARKDEIIRLQRQNSETEQARIDALVRSQSLLESQQAADRQAEQDLRSRVSAAVLEGRCDDAKTISLLASRIDMAEQAMRLCTQKPVGPGAKSTGKAADRGSAAQPPVKATVTARQPTPQPVVAVPSYLERLNREYRERPASDVYAPDQLYWLGRSFAGRSMHAQAADAYLKVYNNHPRNDRAPDALLGLAGALIGIKNPQQACRVLGELDNVYGNLMGVARSADAKALRAEAKCS